jgi:hypothetical protein
VAEGAAEITAAREYDCGGLARIIDERQLLKSVYFHDPSPFLFFFLYYITFFCVLQAVNNILRFFFLLS